MATIHRLSSTQLPWGSNHPIHREPAPHIRRNTTRPIAGWSPSHQPLPAPRLILTPYIGCPGGCEFCFLNGYPGLYRLGQCEQVLTVYDNYPQHLKENLQKLRIAPPAVLSPYTDPFQLINDRYGLSEKIVKECVMINLPLEIVTRYHIPDEVLAMMEHLTHCRIQVSIDPFEREGFVPHYRERLEFMDRISLLGLEVVPRLDPLFLGEENAKEKITNIVSEISKKDLPHIVVGLGRITPALHNKFLSGSKKYYRQHPYRENCWLPKKKPRREYLKMIRKICDENNITLGVLDYPELQKEFGDYPDAFENPLPVSIRSSSSQSFKPLDNCGGNCLLCRDPVCGIPLLHEHPWRDKRLNTSNWDKWGIQHLQELLLP
jgi:DNA repair photolyase